VIEKQPARLLQYHRSLLADRVRTERYREAIARTVRPGDVVLDLGTGTGVLAFFACQAGARRVYAVEAGPVIELARQVCARNGFADRVIFLHDLSYRVRLPEPVDVLVTETMGHFGLDEGLLRALADARQRLLRPGGTSMPVAIELSVAPVELPSAYRRIDAWDEDVYGLDYSPLRRFAANNPLQVKLEPAAFLGEPVSMARIDLTAADAPYLSAETACRVHRPGVLHGLGGWFAAELVTGLAVSNAPPIATPSWDNLFFPLERPVAVAVGDSIRVRLQSQNGAVWRWQVEIEAGACPARFDQSTFWGFPLAPDAFRKRSATYRPELSARGEAERLVLTLCDGQHGVGEIEAELRARHADCFPAADEVSAFVREVIARCT
jgi:predicted RNA methylase